MPPLTFVVDSNTDNVSDDCVPRQHESMSKHPEHLLNLQFATIMVTKPAGIQRIEQAYARAVAVVDMRAPWLKHAP
jgi:hypothetical protein